jgi:hypothetical protein
MKLTKYGIKTEDKVDEILVGAFWLFVIAWGVCELFGW